ncbi:uncharacterized protein LOC112570550 [Pomacea canaliculata]|uniref:uncharacterized protein LOC112570550 n=1 Tax=Pomacea canaliculata TaxID=400727 RepID=UPI000D727E99|nr:uncharacterized protein LOC112570550 [Pomacea canaliculata]
MSTHTTMTRLGWLVLTSFLTIMRVQVICASAHCTSKEAVEREQQLCFSGFADILRNKSLDEIQQLLQTEPRFICNHLVRYREALGCAVNKARECTSHPYKNLLMDEQSMNQMLDKLCDRIDDIDVACARRALPALEQCGISKSLELRNPTERRADQRALLCYTMRVNTECQYRVMLPCGCRTTRLYIDISKSHVNPKGCSPITSVPTPVCDARTGEFVNGSVPSRAGTSVLVALLLTKVGIW